MTRWARGVLRNMRWSEIALGKLALGLIAISVGVALDEIRIRDAPCLFATFAALGVFGYTWNDWWDRATDRAVGRPNAFDCIGAPLGSRDHFSGRNLSATQNPCPRLSGFRPAGIG